MHISKFARKTSVSLTIFFLSFVANAGTFTPSAGTTVTETPLVVSWSTTAPQQWVRAFNPSGQRIYDSGRQTSANGQVQIDIPSNISSVMVIFYERIGGTWTPQERTYSVDLGGDGGDGGSVILSDRISCTTEEIDFSVVDNYNSGTGSIPVMECTLACPTGEFLVAADCNVRRFYGVIDGDESIDPLTSNLVYSGPSQADCRLHGQFDSYLYYNEDTFTYELSGPTKVELSASGACMSIPE